MATSFFLDLNASDFADKMNAMFASLEGQDPLLCALVGAAHVDKCLESLLKAMMPARDNSQTKLKHFEPDGPSGMLGSLFARAEFAYLFGLIDSETMTTIRDIARVRNLFAHSPTPMTFESTDIAKLCMSLKSTPLQIIRNDPSLGDGAKEHLMRMNNDPRFRFVDSVRWTVIQLASLVSRLRLPPSPFKDLPKQLKD